MTGLVRTANRGGLIQMRLDLANPPPEGTTGVRLQLAEFSASGAVLRDIPRPGSLNSVAVVACGRDHDARTDMREVGFY